MVQEIRHLHISIIRIAQNSRDQKSFNENATQSRLLANLLSNVLHLAKEYWQLDDTLGQGAQSEASGHGQVIFNLDVLPYNQS